MKRGAPLSLWVPRLFFAALLALAGPLAADGPEAPPEPDWLSKSRVALKKGEDEAINYATKALKKQPKGGAENSQMALCLFWAGHFEDAARHMRRALSYEANVLTEKPKLGDLMLPADAKARLNELAPLAETDPELCFLCGTMLLLDRDQQRALAFLVRAEELAGTDGQVGALLDKDATDRNRLRGETAMREGQWEDAVRSFAFAALDAPTVAEHYAGLVLALAAQGEDKMALKLAAMIYERYEAEVLFAWLQPLAPRGRKLADEAARLQAVDGAGVEHQRLASMLYFANGWFRGARDAGVQVLLKEKLDDFSRDLQRWMEDKQLSGDPVVEDPPKQPDPETTPDQPAPEAPTLEGARKLVRRGEYTDALKILDALMIDEAQIEVYHLLFVVLVGRNEMQDAGTAMQTWFLKAEDDQRTKLNSLRELFATKELFEAWREGVIKVRDADPNAGLPRLLNSYIEVTRGRYSSAREELVVAKIEQPANLTVQALERILDRDEFQQDRTPDGIQDDPSAKSLMARADRDFNSGQYQAALAGYLAAAEADRKLPYVTIGLMRCYFALADFDNAADQLQVLLTEQEMDKKEPREFQLLLEAGYKEAEKFNQHLATLKAECELRALNPTRWMLYGVILLAHNDYTGARDALQNWYDTDTSKTRDPVIVKFYEYARKRAS